ncbi:lipocalin family protein [uncultured Flavobacterium sp.]|uniref:lipocalin family protein n=1 Tax=uncultured Flavobacterium sp. TaxID=165435 RepID=UPI002931D068|nr:lipocalin family protein [uncultured Flavobacterium sp.]
MKLKNITIGLTFLSLFLLNSCNSDNDSKPTNSNTNLIIGKWTWQEPSAKCPSYREFKINKTLTYMQFDGNCKVLIDNLTYELVGDKIKIGSDEDETETIIELTDKIMTITFVSYNGIQKRTYHKIP